MRLTTAVIDLFHLLARRGGENMESTPALILEEISLPAKAGLCSPLEPWCPCFRGSLGGSFFSFLFFNLANRVEVFNQGSMDSFENIKKCKCVFISSTSN